MASANVTLAGSSEREFECDSTERTATLMNPGGYLVNKHATVSVWINADNGTVSTTDGNATSVEIKPLATYRLPFTGYAFKFKTSASTSYLQYIPQ